MVANLRIVTSFANFFIDTTTASVYRPVLRRHNGLQRRFRLDITREARDFWQNYDDLNTRDEISGFYS